MNCPKCGTSLVVPEPNSGSTAAGLGTHAPEFPEESSGVPPEPGEANQQASGFFDAIELSSDELRTMFPEDTDEDRAEPGQLPEVEQVRRSGGQPESRVRVAEDRRSEEVEPPVPESIGLRFHENPTGRGVRPDPLESSTPNEAIVRPRVSRDVVIPRLAVLSWSMFVLIALFLAFLAGLLVGHFVWVRPE
ncbi:hypothetical protein [Tautonia rosea]|uniref:hypothetical protein n=1 Tax=Tautonia rosea TaxID=2728037 RepID=UPI0014743A67|nr:hypothetical protein [Tautonia rosea]